MSIMVAEKIRLISVPKIPESRGNLSYLQNSDQVPFEIKRVYWINAIQGNKHSTGHAHKNTNILVIALSGSFEVLVNDGTEEQVYLLNRPEICLSIPAMVWHKLRNFSTNSVAFVAADRPYDEMEELMDFSRFKTELQYA